MTNSNSRFSRKLLVATITGLLLLLSFSYGFVSGKFKIFPYGIIADTGKAASPVLEKLSADSLSEKLVTSLVEFNKTSYNRRGTFGLEGSGGALDLVGSIVVGVDSRGQFFRYNGHGRVVLLPIDLETGENDFLRHVSSIELNERRRQATIGSFRILDLAVRDRPNKVSIFVSHNYWDEVKKGKTSRISRLMISRNEAQAILDGDRHVQESDWEVIYETHPLLEFDTAPRSDFRNNHSGGRMIIDETGGLIVGFGDQHYNYDNVDEPFRPQDDSTSFGKLLRIDLESLEVAVYALGMRNPQGLTMDSDGNIWATEHGPEGGDELNLIRPDTNYGWPYETYGTEYFTYKWPLSEQQGRHIKYAKPVFAWVPSIAPSNLIQVRDVPSEWDGDLLVSSLRAMSLFRLRLHESRVVFAEPVLIGERIRDLVQMPDGNILIWADSGRLVELHAL